MDINVKALAGSYEKHDDTSKINIMFQQSNTKTKLIQ